MMVSHNRHLLLDVGHVVLVDGGWGVVVVVGAVLALHVAHIREIIQTHPSSLGYLWLCVRYYVRSWYRYVCLV